MRIYSLFFLFILSKYSQSQEATLRVESAINFPLKITFKSLEEVVNTKISGLIYADTSHFDNANDQFKCLVNKNGAIKLSHIKNNILKLDVPLKIWAEKGLGTLGVYTYQSTEFQVIMSFQMNYIITKDWKLKTKTVKNGFTWVQKPSLEFVKIKFPLSGLIENTLDKKQEESAKIIDENLNQSFQLKKDIIQVWNRLKTPQLISEKYKTWLIFTPLNIESSPFTQDALSINSNVKINLISETVLSDSIPPNSDTTDIPSLKTSQLSPSDFKLYTLIHMPYSELNEITKSKFVGQEFDFKNGKYKVKLTNISLQTIEKQIQIDVDMEGSYNGKLLILGTPYYDEAKNIVKLKDVRIDLKTKNILIMAYGWLFSGKLEEIFETKFEIPTKENMDYSKAMTHQALNQNKEGIKFKGYITEMKPKEIIVLQDKLCLSIITHGGLQIEF